MKKNCLFKKQIFLACLFALFMIKAHAQPSTAAPSPTKSASDVISLYSGAYTNKAGTNWAPWWSQSTSVSNETIAGDEVIKYSNFNYIGVEFAGTVNASSMSKVHIDVYSTDCTAFQFYLIGGGNEQGYSLTPNNTGWNSFDIDLAEYSNIPLANIIQFKFVSDPAGSTVYVDNIYFWKSSNVPTITGFTLPAKYSGDAGFTLTDPQSNSTGAFTYSSSNTAVATVDGNTVTILGVGTSTITATQAAAGGYLAGTVSATLSVTFPLPTAAAPTPTRAAANVVSLFSNAYTNVAVGTWRTNWSAAGIVEEQIAGNDVKQYNNLNYVGIEPGAGNAIDASKMLYFHVDAYTTNMTQFRVKLVDFGADGAYDGGDDVNHELIFTPTMGGWNSYEIPLSDFAGLTTKGHIAQIIFAGNPVGTGVLYVDNIYFHNVAPAVAIVPTTAAPTPTKAAANVMSLFSDAYANVSVDTWRTDWSSAGLTDLQLEGNNTKKYSALDFVGIETTGANMLDLISFDSIHFNLWTPNITAFKVKLVDFGADGNWQGTDNSEHQISLTPTVSGWNSFNIALTDFTGLTQRAHVAQLIFSGVPVGSGTAYLDNIYFSKIPAVLATVPTTAAATPPARNAWDVVSFYGGAYTNIDYANWFPGWGQGTQYEEVQPGGNAAIHYSALDYEGVEFPAKDVSNMTKLHLDVWTPNCAGFEVHLIGGGDHYVTLTPTLSGWNAFDIDLSQFAGADLHNIFQFMFRDFPMNYHASTTSVYLDNIYFYRAATAAQPPTMADFSVTEKILGDAAFNLVAPTSNSTGAITYSSSNTAVATISGTTVTIVGAGSASITATQAAADSYGVGTISATLVVSYPAPVSAAPTPTVPADRVISLFSNAYTNVGVNTWRTDWSNTGFADVKIAGNDTKKYFNLGHVGIETVGANLINASDMKTLHIDVYTPNVTAFNIKLVDFGANAVWSGGDDVEHELTLTPTLSGWNSYNIALSDFAGLTTKAHIAQLVLSCAPYGSGVVYVDNIYFTKPTPSYVAPVVTSPLTYCIKATATALSATAVAGNTLKWYAAATGGKALATAPVPVTSAAGAKTYYVAQVHSDLKEGPRAAIVVNTIALPATPGAITGLATVGNYVGTDKTVTYSVVKAAGITYNWVLPTGVDTVSRNAAGDTITVKFSRVGAGAGTIGNLSAFAVNANGCVSATAKVLAITKALPATPGTITSSVADVGMVINTATKVSYSIADVATANSYEWTVPAGAAIVGSATGNTIAVSYSSNFKATGAVTVKSVNGTGSSTAKSLSVKFALPATPGAITGSTTTCTGATKNYSFVPSATATGYKIKVPAGCVVKTVGNTSNASDSITTSLLAFSVTYSSNYLTGSIAVTATNGAGSSAAKSITVKKTTTGCSANRFGAEAETMIDNKMGVNIYPNPSRGEFKIAMKSSDKLSPVKIEITNQQGQSVYRRSTANNNGQVALSVNPRLANGVYMVTCTVGTERITKTIIIAN